MKAGGKGGSHLYAESNHKYAGAGRAQKSDDNINTQNDTRDVLPVRRKQELIQKLQDRHTPRHLVEASAQALETEGFRLTPKEYTIVISSLGRKAFSQQAISCLERMMVNGQIQTRSISMQQSVPASLACCGSVH